MPLILLEHENRILYEMVYSTFKRIIVGDENSEEKVETQPMENKFCDFDGTRLRVLITPEDVNSMTVSLSMPCWRDLKDLGIDNYMSGVYGDLVGEVESDYDFTIKVDLKNLPQDYEALSHRIALVKFHALGSPFQKYFKSLAAGKTEKAGKVRLSDDTEIYFTAKSDRVTIIFSLNFKERFDEVISHVFLNSFVDVKRGLGNAPVVSYDGNVPPNEMKSDFRVNEKIGNAGFFTFSILSRHVENQKKIDTATALLQNFSMYVRYHIKCSKTYFHSNMRKRVADLLLVLNRAKSEDEEALKKKKLASGRNFVEAKGEKKKV